MASPLHLSIAQQCYVEKTKEEEEAIEKTYAKYVDIIKTLPKSKSWFKNGDMYNYQGFWFHSSLEGVMWMQQHFKARPSDVVLATSPKCGTTWFKALVFAIVNRTKYEFSDHHPLLIHSPHDCVPYLEHKLFKEPPIGDPEVLPSPRILATHVGYPLLPESVVSSGCRIICVCRNPKDVFVSLWHFLPKIEESAVSVEEAFDSFCHGTSIFGPYWEHSLGYWKASSESPDKVFFVKYEEMKEKPCLYAKKLAEFLGYPFSLEEEEGGVVKKIVDLCSFEKMRSLEVNKSGIHKEGVQNHVFFREGKVGDWKNYLTAEMVERIDKITIQKFENSGLAF